MSARVVSVDEVRAPLFPLLEHAARARASLARSARKAGYISDWIGGAIFDRGLLPPLERLTKPRLHEALRTA